MNTFENPLKRVAELKSRGQKIIEIDVTQTDDLPDQNPEEEWIRVGNMQYIIPALTPNSQTSDVSISNGAVDASQEQ